MVVNGGKRQNQTWQTFAARGMGWFAGSVDGDDTTPVEDFSMPPALGTPTGVVTDLVTGAPLAGAVVAFGGHNSGFAGSYAATTNASGVYTITGIFAGTYPKVFSRSPGFDPVVRTVSIAARTQTLNWQLRRDWAALSGGATVEDFNGDDFTFLGCGPPSMFDQSQGFGWSTDATYINVPPAPDLMEERFVIVELPVAVDVSEIQINPANTCGDAGSASTSRYRLETSTDGVTYSSISGDFGITDRFMHAVSLPATPDGVKFVRYVMPGFHRCGDRLVPRNVG